MRLPDGLVERVDQLHRLADLIPEFTRYLRNLNTQLVTATRRGPAKTATAIRRKPTELGSDPGRANRSGWVILPATKGKIGP
jgi:hypothetical protein